MGNSYKMLIGIPEGKTPHGGRRRGRENKIKIYLKEM
jgi:hypothetical protein